MLATMQRKPVSRLRQYFHNIVASFCLFGVTHFSHFLRNLSTLSFNYLCLDELQRFSIKHKPVLSSLIASSFIAASIANVKTMKINKLTSLHQDLSLHRRIFPDSICTSVRKAVCPPVISQHLTEAAMRSTHEHCFPHKPTRGCFSCQKVSCAHRTSAKRLPHTKLQKFT